VQSDPKPLPLPKTPPHVRAARPQYQVHRPTRPNRRFLCRECQVLKHPQMGYSGVGLPKAPSGSTRYHCTLLLIAPMTSFSLYPSQRRNIWGINDPVQYIRSCRRDPWVHR
jgi:hypothetical protein